jgi:hypothetical protein
MSRYTLTEGAKQIAAGKGKFVVKSHSHAMTRRLEQSLTGLEWYGPLSLGSKTKLYMADDTEENRAVVLRMGGM